jgi:hypothetical protein
MSHGGRGPGPFVACLIGTQMLGELCRTFVLEFHGVIMKGSDVQCT